MDSAESEPVMANAINHLAVRTLSEVAKQKNVNLIHISTDYVFNGKSYMPYEIDHPTDPVNLYGETKLAGEKALQELNPANSIIIRTSWVYSSYGNNFVKTMLRLGEDRKELKVICDQVGAPTYARDLAEFILQKAIHSENENVETFHFTNEGVCSWYDFAREIMTQAGLDCAVHPISTAAYPTPAKRPYYSLMDKSKVKQDFKLQIPHWKESIRTCIQILNKDSKIKFNLDN